MEHDRTLSAVFPVLLRQNGGTEQILLHRRSNTGYMDGRVMDVKEVVAIANLPSREVLLSMLVSALSGPMRGLAVALNAVAEKKGEEGAA